MGRNRRNQPGAVRLAPAIKALVLCLLLGGSGVGYVWQKNQIHELGAQIKRREIRLDELRMQNRARREQLANLQLPSRLEQRVRERDLQLAPAQPGQIVRLPEPVIERVLRRPGAQYASRPDAGNVP